MWGRREGNTCRSWGQCERQRELLNSGREETGRQVWRQLPRDTKKRDSHKVGRKVSEDWLSLIHY